MIRNLEASLSKTNLIEMKSIKKLSFTAGGQSKISIGFSNEGRNYNAFFTVARANSGNLLYNLTAEIWDLDAGKSIITKVRPELDYGQIQHSIAYILHEAFVLH